MTEHTPRLYLRVPDLKHLRAPTFIDTNTVREIKAGTVEKIVVQLSVFWDFYRTCPVQLVVHIFFCNQ